MLKLATLSALPALAAANWGDLHARGSRPLGAAVNRYVSPTARPACVVGHCHPLAPHCLSFRHQPPWGGAQTEKRVRTLAMTLTCASRANARAVR